MSHRLSTLRLLTVVLALNLLAMLPPTAAAQPASTVRISVNTVQGLREAIAQSNLNPAQGFEISVATNLTLTEFNDSGAALPPIRGILGLTGPGSLAGGGPGSGFRLLTIEAGGALALNSIMLTNFHANGDGGVIRAEPGSEFSIFFSSFTHSGASGAGGAIYATGALSAEIDSARFEHCTAMRGGAVALLSAQTQSSQVLTIGSSDFLHNSAGSGGALYLEGS
ncbi:MAG: hypothetical protein KDI56_12120, partial [Xanthomonadales bacterium]|nr:hypothetical protein [Xanthomonadales bacterium]